MPSIPIVQLEIVAYADVLDQDTPPCKVAPIFRFREDHNRLLFPPFRLVDDHVDGAIEGDPSELEELLADGGATRLADGPIQALPNSVLWVENGAEWHYQNRYVQLRNWRHLATTHYLNAKKAFEIRGFSRASSLARKAFAMDERKLEALALQAAADEQSNDNEGSKSLRAVAAQLFDVAEFDDKFRLLMTIHRSSSLRDMAIAEYTYGSSEDQECALAHS